MAGHDMRVLRARGVAGGAGAACCAPPPEGALLPEQGEAGALTLPCVLGQDARCVCARPRVAPPCLLRVPDACPVRVPRPVGP